MMIIPAKYKRYLTGTFDQADEIQKRANHYMSVLQAARDMMVSNPASMTEVAKTLYGKNVDLLKNAHNNREGACQCLAIKWLKLKMKEQAAGMTGKNKVDPRTRLDQLRDPPRLDKVLQKMSASTAVQVFTRSFEEAMNQFHVTPKPYWDAAIPMTRLCKTVMAQPHAYFVAGIKCPNLGGNHAIAIYTSDGGLLGTGKHAHVFDPNIGEIKLPLKEFGTLFPGLLGDCYGTGENDVLLFAELIRGDLV